MTDGPDAVIAGLRYELQVARLTHNAVLADRDKQRDRAQRMQDALADVVTKATDYGTQDGEFVANYLLPTGPIHRAIPLLQEFGVTVRPGRPANPALARARTITRPINVHFDPPPRPAVIPVVVPCPRCGYRR